MGPGKGASAQTFGRPVFKTNFTGRGGGVYGTVSSFHEEKGLWLVTYEDGKTEEYDDKALNTILVPPPPPPPLLLPTTTPLAANKAT